MSEQYAQLFAHFDPLLIPSITEVKKEKSYSLINTVVVGTAAASVLPAAAVILAGIFMQPEDFAAAVLTEQVRDIGCKITVTKQAFSDFCLPDGGFHPAWAALETVNACIIESVAVHIGNSLFIKY